VKSSAKRKILFLNHNYENFGTFWRCFFLARQLCGFNNEMTMVCASRDNFDPKIKTKKIRDNFKIITLPRIRLHPYHTGHLMRGVINSQIVMLNDFDILHGFAVAQPSTALPVAVAKMAGKKNIVVDWDDDWSSGLGRYHPLPVRRVISFLEHGIPRLAKKVTVVSDYLKFQALKLGIKEESICQIPNGSNIDEIRPLDKEICRRELGIGGGEQVILAMGHNYMESFELLIDVFLRVTEKSPKAKFYLVGNPGRKNANLLKRKLRGLERNMVFLGEQPFVKIPCFLASADVLLLPMADTVFERSRFPVRLGDYLASGRPIVSNAVGEVKSVLEKYQCGLTCGPQDLKGFAEQILILLNNPDLRNKLGDMARKTAEEYSWQKIAQRLNRFYDNL
jgi:glycosyltransferase involved in cell wall biosynthesis